MANGSESPVPLIGRLLMSVIFHRKWVDEVDGIQHDDRVDASEGLSTAGGMSGRSQRHSRSLAGLRCSSAFRRVLAAWAFSYI